MATEGDGYAHISIGTSVILKPSISSTKLSESVQNAWIRLRHYAPLIALRTQQGGNDNDTFYTYESSKTSDVAAKWAKDTIKWEKEEKTLDARDLDLKERWWGPEDHWNMEMHVGPGPEGRLHFMLQAPHWVIDGHLSLPLLDKFLEYFVAEVEGKAERVDGLKWGDETRRLPPALIEAISEKYRGNHASPAESPVAEQPATSVPSLFMRPVDPIPQTSKHSTLSYAIVLTRAETEAFHKKCKAHKSNVTPVVNSLLVLADVETTLWWGRRQGKEKFNVVKQMFETADVFPIPINGMDRRAAFMPEHHDLESPLGTPGVASEGYPTRHDMNVVRKSILLTEDGQIQRNMSDETFWDGVVANAIEILEPGRPISPTFRADQVRFAGLAVQELTGEVLASRVLCSSIGDIDKYGFLRRWRPSTATAESTLVIDRLILSIRISTPTICCICYQYDGHLTLQLQGSSQHNSQEAWQYFGEAVESRIRYILGAGGRMA
jgi:hypothetical protein